MNVNGARARLATAGFILSWRRGARLNAPAASRRSNQCQFARNANGPAQRSAALGSRPTGRAQLARAVPKFKMGSSERVKYERLDKSSYGRRLDILFQVTRARQLDEARQNECGRKDQGAHLGGGAHSLGVELMGRLLKETGERPTAALHSAFASLNKHT